MTMLELLERLSWFVTQFIRYLLFPGSSPSVIYTVPSIIMNNPILLLFALLPFVTLIIYIFRRLLKTI